MEHLGDLGYLTFFGWGKGVEEGRPAYRLMLDEDGGLRLGVGATLYAFGFKRRAYHVLNDLPREYLATPEQVVSRALELLSQS